VVLPSSAKEQREMTKSCVFWRTFTTMANFSCLPFELNAVITYLAWASFKTDMRTEQIYTVATCEGKILILVYVISKTPEWLGRRSGFSTRPWVLSSRTASEFGWRVQHFLQASLQYLRLAVSGETYTHPNCIKVNGSTFLTPGLERYCRLNSSNENNDRCA